MLGGRKTTRRQRQTWQPPEWGQAWHRPCLRACGGTASAHTSVADVRPLPLWPFLWQPWETAAGRGGQRTVQGKHRRDATLPRTGRALLRDNSLLRLPGSPPRCRAGRPGALPPEEGPTSQSLVPSVHGGRPCTQWLWAMARHRAPPSHRGTGRAGPPVPRVRGDPRISDEDECPPQSLRTSGPGSALHCCDSLGSGPWEEFRGWDQVTWFFILVLTNLSRPWREAVWV